MTPGKSLFNQLHDRDPEVREAAQRRIAAEVARHGGDARAAAEALGISARTARRWMDAFAGPQQGGAAPGATRPPVASPPATAPPAATPDEPADGPVPEAPHEPADEAADRAANRQAPEPTVSATEAQPAASSPPPAGPRHRGPFSDFGPAHGRTLDEQRGAADLAGAARPGDEPPGGSRAAAPAPLGAVSPEEAATAGATPAWEPAPDEAAAAAGPAAGGGSLAARAGGEWPHHQPEATAPREGGEGDGGPRRLAFVLHAHLPWVLGHGTWPHGEEWLAEAVVHCYLPLLDALERLAARGGRDLLTWSLSPVLAAQLADARCGAAVTAYLTHRRDAARELAAIHPLADWWAATYERRLAGWEARGGDLLGAIARLQRGGAIEVSTCAVTHGYLPLLHRREHVALQVGAAVANHERWFGVAPAGLWMPECAYRPGGPWRHPATGAVEGDRPGNEVFLAAAGIRWTVADAHLVLGGEPVLPYDLLWGAAAEGAAPEAPPPIARRLQPLWIDGSEVAVLPREPHAAHQVWSRQGGYPGDPRYLDFHKRHAESGLRLWQVTDAGGDLADKLPYYPDGAAAAVRDQAAHFVDLLARVPGLGGGVAVCPYDAELFGHWWFEGVDWLEAVLARCLDDPRVNTTTPSRELGEHPPAARVRLGEGSWGEAGDHRVWVNDGTSWMWDELREAEDAVAAALPSAAPELARALLAQLLLLAASDWPFLVTTGTAADYAADRFRTHAGRLRELLADGGGTLPDWARDDLAGLAIDPAWWRRGER